MRKTLIVVIALLTAVGAVAPAAAAAGAAPGVASESFDAETPNVEPAVQDAPECEYPLELEDATGETVTLEEEPDRVVALQPSDARTTFDIGAEDRLVGMPVNPGTSDIDPGDRTDVTDQYEILTEVVVDLEPDVVLAANITSAEDVQQLRDSDLTVYQFGTAGSLEDVRRNARVTGRLTGECEGASETVERMDDRLAVVESAVEDEDRPLGYYEMSDGQTTGANTFQHEVLTTAGLENLAASVGLDGWGQLNAETIVDEDPAWIVYPDWSDEPQYPEGVETTTAVEEENFVAVNDNRMNQPAPQVVDAIDEIVQAVHPEAYEEAQAALEDGNESDGGSESGNGADESGGGNESDDTSGNETDSGSDDGDESGSDDGNESESDDGSNSENETNGDDGEADGGDDETDGGDDENEESIPGFGVPAAAAALALAVGFVMRRR